MREGRNKQNGYIDQKGYFIFVNAKLSLFVIDLIYGLTRSQAVFGLISSLLISMSGILPSVYTL